MARILKEEDYAAKRAEILDTAQRLVYTKGYEQMTIQDVIEALQISKGAFYHYFSSKPALLEAMVERSAQEVLLFLTPIVEDPRLPALEKLNRYMASAVQWKSAQKAYMLELLRVWYTDDNAIVRQKLYASMLKLIIPMLAKIIRQGAEEGVFQTAYPTQAAAVLVSVIQGLGDTFAEVFLSPGPKNGSHLRQVVESVAAYTDALERVLGAPKGSIVLMEASAVQEWLDVPPGN